MNFFVSITSSFWLQSILKLILGFVLSGVIGLERSSWNKPAGFRTHALLGLSAVLVMLCGEYMSERYDIDPSRIPAQLLSGIGFLGAGTILRDGFNVKGLTTAAGLLAVTCIGLSIGAGFYLGGIVTTLIVYIILSYSYKISDRLDHFDDLEMEISISDKLSETLEEIQNILTQFNVEIKHIKTTTSSELNTSAKDKAGLIRISGHYHKREFSTNKLISSITSVKNVEEVIEN
jgi:putative Mg2+ transporter-C (MgtC) family protein